MAKRSSPLRRSKPRSKPCRVCDGTGSVVWRGDYRQRRSATCYRCKGTGKEAS
jgi:DnaJ-class molecular chaperone